MRTSLYSKHFKLPTSCSLSGEVWNPDTEVGFVSRRLLVLVSHHFPTGLILPYLLSPHCLPAIASLALHVILRRALHINTPSSLHTSLSISTKLPSPSLASHFRSYVSPIHLLNIRYTSGTRSATPSSPSPYLTHNPCSLPALPKQSQRSRSWKMS